MTKQPMTERTHDEHLAWCKKRALEYLSRGELHHAVTSMASDLDKHPETATQDIAIMMLGMVHACDRDVAAVRCWIEGFQ